VGLERCRRATWKKSSGSGLENQDYCRRGSAVLTTRHSPSAKVGTNLSDKQRSLGRYSSLAGKNTEFLLFIITSLINSEHNPKVQRCYTDALRPLDRMRGVYREVPGSTRSLLHDQSRSVLIVGREENQSPKFTATDTNGVLTSASYGKKIRPRRAYTVT
jgi:hypothetical protein